MERGHGRLVAACLAVLCIPLLVALAGFRRPTWTPVLDLAMTELRARDVFGRHTPLIGLPGRIGSLAEQGSHPGPLSFYALAPTYRLFGSTAWALQVATFLIHAVAMGTALLIAARRGGTRLVLVVAALLAVLTAGYGGGTLTEPWNPYLPLLWWVVVLLAVWSVLCGDVAMLPVAVLAASFCAQTHVPYLGLTLGMGALATGAAVLRWRRTPEERRTIVRWLLVSAGLGVVLWLPPTIDQVRHDPGNYERLIEHFSDPEEEPRGLGEGVDVGLRYLDLTHLARADVTDPGWLVTNADGNRPTSGRGAVLFALWAGAAVVGVRRRAKNDALVALHAVIGAGIVLMVVAISRIFGSVWYYLTLWGWAIGLLALVATVWTVADVVGERWDDERRASAGRRASIALLAVALLAVGRFTVDAWNSPHADATVARDLAAIVDQVADGLDAREGLATGHDGRYLVTWSDAFHIGSQGYGLLSELERRGFDVGIGSGRRVPGTAHRVLAPADATARIHLATGVFVARWRDVPDAVEIASVDPRSHAEREELDILRAEVTATLRDLGLDELVPELQDNLFGAAIDERVPDATQEQMGRMLAIGGPLAVFVVPVDTPEP
ncbi:MAG: hypothetical protein ACRDZU_11745 [Acidimicrobiales bacterium]